MWQPISQHELEVLISHELEECSAETRELYEANAISMQKWALPPWGDAGGGFWAIAVLGGLVLWFNDIEDGFNTSSFVNAGVIDHYWCNQDTLHQALFGLTHNTQKLGAPDVGM